MIILFRSQWNVSLKRLLLCSVIYGLLSSLTAATDTLHRSSTRRKAAPPDSHTFRHSLPSHHHKALQEPHPALVLLTSSRSHWTRGLWGAAHGVASFSSAPTARWLWRSAQVWDAGWVLTWVRPVLDCHITSSRCLQVPTGSEIRLWWGQGAHLLFALAAHRARCDLLPPFSRHQPLLYIHLLAYWADTLSLPKFIFK